MDVTGFSDETLRTSTPGAGRGSLLAKTAAIGAERMSPSTAPAGAALQKSDSLPVQPIGINRRESAISFETVAERDRAIDLIWDEAGPLFQLPYDVGDQTTLIVPASAARLFVESGLRCHESPVKSQSKALAEAGVTDLNGDEMGVRPSHWRSSLALYRGRCVLKFETVDERDRAIEMIWDETGPLFRLPYDVSDRTSLVVPDEAVKFFTAQGLKFA